MAVQEINVESLMQHIRKEVARRKQGTPAISHAGAPEPLEPSELPRMSRAGNSIKAKPAYEIRDFLDYHDEEFVRSAYHGILRREPDGAGNAHYLSALRRGDRSKVEILGALRYSPEGRGKRVAVRGLLFSYAMRRAFRVPVFGYALQLGNYLLRLPTVVRNFERYEAWSNYGRTQNVEQFNVVSAAAEAAINKTATAANHAHALAHRAMLSSSTKAEEGSLEQVKQNILGQLAVKADRESFAMLTARLAEISEQLKLKADIERLNALANHLGSVSDRAASIEAAKANARDVEKTAEMLRLAIATKADRRQLEDLIAHAASIDASKASTQDLEKAADLLRLAIAAKADRQQLDGLTARAASIEAAKANARDVEKIAELLRVAIAAKADQQQLDGLIVRAASLEAAKANAQDVEKVAELLRVAIAAKADQQQLDSLSARAASLEAAGLDVATTRHDLAELQRQIHVQELGMLDQHRRLATLLDEARKRLPKPLSSARIADMLGEEDHLLDSFYVAFEDRFRGSREDIMQRVAIYLPLVRKAGAGTAAAPVLDIGCGRGEWLELLKANGLTGRGVDKNRVSVSQCRKLGLKVTEADAVGYLRGLKTGSLGAVTAIHIAEHLPFVQLVALFDEILRVLKSGGVAIVETPNPENLIVGACNFYYDPTHRHPLPPESLRFIMQKRGFGGVEILRLHPYPEAAWLKEGPAQVREVLNGMLFGAQDYSLVAHKD